MRHNQGNQFKSFLKEVVKEDGTGCASQLVAGLLFVQAAFVNFKCAAKVARMFDDTFVRAKLAKVQIVESKVFQSIALTDNNASDRSIVNG